MSGTESRPIDLPRLKSLDFEDWADGDKECDKRIHEEVDDDAESWIAVDTAQESDKERAIRDTVNEGYDPRYYGQNDQCDTHTQLGDVASVTHWYAKEVSTFERVDAQDMTQFVATITVNKGRQIRRWRKDWYHVWTT